MTRSKATFALLPSIAAVLVCAAAPAMCESLAGFFDRFQERPTEPTSVAETPLPQREEPIQRIVAPHDLNPDKVALGRTLFHEPGLSGDGTISCASCHCIADGGDDDRRFSLGIGGNEGTHNAPTVLNASLNFKQYWNGRADSLEEQVAGPLHSATEMGSSWEQAVAFLESKRAYRAWFLRIYDDAITADNITDAIVEYERSLVTPESPFDQWLAGNDDALTAKQKKGYAEFKNAGCISCHQGTNVGGNLFQPLGVMVQYFEDLSENQANLGRYNVTGDERDLHVFKVPGLRNVAETAPYFHDGSAQTLQDAVRIMYEHQLGMAVDDRTVDNVSAFLRSLSATPAKGAR